MEWHSVDDTHQRQKESRSTQQSYFDCRQNKKKVRREPYREPKKIVPTTNEGKPKTRREGFLTIRWVWTGLCLRGSWSRQPPGWRADYVTKCSCDQRLKRKSRWDRAPKDCCSLCRAWKSKDDRIQGKTKHLSQAFREMVAGWRERRGGRGGERGSDKHTRYSNSPSCLCPPLLSDRGKIVKGERDRGGAVACDFLFFCRSYLAML